MRWFLGFLLVIALVLGALFAVGTFLLPNTLEVMRTVTVERPRAAVFAMVNDLRIAKEWSPYYARDPDADYTFSGDAGSGQTMRWSSDVREVGSGRMSIVNSIPNEEVQSILEMGERATLNADMVLRTVEGGTAVSWTVSAECGGGWITVPCRYMNLILRGVAAKELDSGLARLKTLAEQLPNVNFEDLNPQFDDIAAQPFVYSVVETAANNPEEIERAESLGLDQVRRFMNEYQLTAAGPLTRVVTEQSSDRMTYRVGYPYAGARPLTVVGVQVGETPSGQAMHVLVEGDRANVAAAYAQMDAYLQAHRIPRREDALPWHTVIDAGDTMRPSRIEI
ncbi:MAG: SRPBCC family protein, partial [Hyphomonadaceae bacterium]|nr:SRPBCC family protein [Hyphomonadaceae bacterium]